MASTDPPLRGFVILVVEDYADTLEVLEYLICEKLGCRVLAAPSVDEALQIIDSGSHVDLVFSDIVMPGKDGLTLAEQVRKRRPDLPVVLATGRPDIVDALLEAGWVALLKPYTTGSLEAVFTEQLGVEKPHSPAPDRRSNAA